MRRALTFGFLIQVLAAARLPADEGRIPVFQPTTITQAGSYILTRDVGVMSGDVIVIDASDVDLDLNGRTIRSSDTLSGALISIGDNHDNVRIHNGRLRGGSFGISYDGAAATTVRLESLEIRGVGVNAVDLTNARYFEMSSCVVRSIGNNGVSLTQGGGVIITGRIVDSQFVDIANYAMIIGAHQGFLVRNNILSSVGGTTILLGGGNGDIVEGNTLTSIPVTGATTAGIGLYSDGALIVNNVFKGYSTAIGVASSGNRIVGNVIRGGTTAGGGLGDGIGLGATGGVFRTLIEGNQIEGNAGCGIRFGSTASGSAYRNNMLRSNGGGAVCNGGSGNTDAGGNIL